MRQMQSQVDIPLDDSVRRRNVVSDGRISAITDDAEDTDWSYPEGGKEAWSCLIGSFALMFPSFGFQTASRRIAINNQLSPR